LFNPAELIAINSLASQNRISDGFKKYGLAKVLWLWLSKLYVAERQYHEAELAAKAAFAIDELDPEVYYRLGRAFEAQGANRLSEAIEAYEKGLDIDPSHPGCNLGLARKHLQMAQREVSDKLTAEIGLAIHHAKATLRARPTDHRAAHLVAQAYHLMGLEREAGDAYQTALSLQEHTPLLFIAPNAFIIATVPFL
jgi:tetratricopeptide (TPR) repeat protein